MLCAKDLLAHASTARGCLHASRFEVGLLLDAMHVLVASDRGTI